MARILLLAAFVLLAAGCGAADDADEVADDEYDISAQPDAAASFVTPSDGDTTGSPVAIEMAAEGVEIVPVDAPAVGEAHFHVVVDAGCVEEGDFFPGPSDEAEADGYFHFGDGSTETELELEPGTHELCLQLADAVHAAFGTPETIQITVE